MILGGIIGWILWMFLPQNYTATTRLSVSIDYNRTGKLEDLEQDRLLGITEDILHSDVVMKQLYQQTDYADYPTFFNTTATTRTNDTWSLSVTGKDPEECGRIAVLWLDTAYDALMQAKSHAIKAEAYRNELEGLTNCIQDGLGQQPSSGCLMDIEETHQQIEFYTQFIQEESAASHGLSTAIRIGQKNPEQLEIRPASRTAAVDTFLGALIGLLIAFAIPWIHRTEDPE